MRAIKVKKCILVLILKLYKKEIIMQLYTTQELNHLYEDEIMNLLKNSWNINEDEKIEVYGKFQSHVTSSNTYYCSLIEVKTLSHHQIEYPLVNNIHSLKDRGIYIAHNNNHN